MTEEEANKILDTANFLLRYFPYENPKLRSGRNFHRRPHLRAKNINNRKIFFNILREKYQGLNKRDKARRYKIIYHLREILSTEVPLRKRDSYIYFVEKNKKNYIIVIKEIKRGGHKELYLFSIYPT